MTARAPIFFTYGNCVFAAGANDPWAVLRVDVDTYAWLGAEAKRQRLLALLGAFEAVHADIQVLRVEREWDVGRYAREALGETERPSAYQRVARKHGASYLEEHVRRLRDLAPATPAVYLAVSLREPTRDVASYVSLLPERSFRDVLSSLRRAFALGESRLLRGTDLERVRLRADQVQARVSDFLEVRPARSSELQWLVRRAFCRGLGEPLVDGLHEPSALAFERNGEAVLAPLEADVLRWTNSCVDAHGRSLEIESELGRSWQAMLVVGALPERVSFPSSAAELMFAPPDSLPFGIDLSLTARFLPNELAVRIARRRIQDADQILRAESEGDQGVSDLGYERTQLARDLLSHLQASSRPPLLRATLAVAIGAADEDELEARVEACRRAFGEVALHRPLGDQIGVFVQHLPAQRTRVAGYDDTLTTEQAAALMPTAARIAGSRSGFYLGYTLSGSRQPVRFNLREGSDVDRNATILSIGALGSGKTTLDQKLKYEAFLLGARVVDCDPKGDHRFHLLQEVAPHVQSIALRPDPQLRGVLDPLLVAPEHLRQDATVSFLRDLLPSRAHPDWETAIVAAVDRVMRRAREPTSGAVVRALHEGDETDQAVARALAVYARSGLTQLGFAEPGRRPRVRRDRQVTYLPIRDLPGPDPAVPRAEYSQAERIGEQLVRLIAMFAMHLMGRERDRLKLFSFDEGWRLLGDPVGRTLLASLQRMGRSELAVPVISTQLVTDALVGQRESLENLIGATFVFGMRSEQEAARALGLLGLDADDRHLRGALMDFDAGRCLFRDHHGRVEAIQVDVVVPALMKAFSTTPARV
jgi:AAA-like domain